MINCKIVILLISFLILDKGNVFVVGVVFGKWILSWILRVRCNTIEKEDILVVRMIMIKVGMNLG